MPHRERVLTFSGAAPHAVRGHSPTIKKRASRWGRATTSHQPAKPIDFVLVAGCPAPCLRSENQINHEGTENAEDQSLTAMPGLTSSYLLAGCAESPAHLACPSELPGSIQMVHHQY